MKHKFLVIALSLTLLLCFALGVTLAWITARTPSIQNVFTTVGITLRLEETFNTDTNSDGVNDAWKAKLYPGAVYAKDPVVTVEEGSEACWLFVHIDDTGNAFTNGDQIIGWSINNGAGWTLLADATDAEDNPLANVYYIELVDAVATDASYQVLQGGDGDLANGKVTISNLLDSTNMPGSDLTITVTAYAVQHTGFATALDAWNEAKMIPEA